MEFSSSFQANFIFTKVMNQRLYYSTIDLIYIPKPMKNKND